MFAKPLINLSWYLRPIVKGKTKTYLNHISNEDNNNNFISMSRNLT